MTTLLNTRKLLITSAGMGGLCMYLCTSIKIAMHGACRLHMLKIRTPVHDACKGKYSMYSARQTPVHDARIGKISMHDEREAKKAVHVCRRFSDRSQLPMRANSTAWEASKDLQKKMYYSCLAFN